MINSGLGAHRGRLAFVVQNLNYGGMERVIHSLAQALPGLGFQVHVVVLDYFGRFADGLPGIAGLHQARPSSRLSVIHPSELANVLRSIRPDLVHSHGGIWFQAARASRMAGVGATVHTEHGRSLPVPRVDHLLDWLASRWTDVVVTVSEPLTALLKTHIVCAGADVRTITNGIQTSPISSEPERVALRQALGIPPNDAVIGSIGRLEPVKNYPLAIRALAGLAERLPSGKAPILVLVGAGSDLCALQGLAGSLGVASRVRFLGWREDATDLYGAFDLFTLTSRSEGTSISLLEAMGAGLPPVVTDVGGNRHVLGPDLASLLVPDGDVRALTGTWLRILDDPTLRERLGAMARQRVQAAFSFDKMIGDHIALYEELLGQSPRRASAPMGGD